jgi:hypothetical protein
MQSMPCFEQLERLLIRHTISKIVELTFRKVQDILAMLHVLSFKSAQALHDNIDQTAFFMAWLITARFPPHSSAEFGVLDVLYLFGRNLRAVIRHHGFRPIVIAVTRERVAVMHHFGSGTGQCLNAET